MEFVGGTSPFFTGSDIQPFIRKDVIAQCLSDTDADISTPFTSPFFVAMHQAASGELEASCLRGGRYSAADIAAMEGNAKYLVCMILAGLIKGYCRERGATLGTQDQAAVITSRSYLKQLREGAAIFPFREAQQAGVLDSRDESSEAVVQRNTISRRAWGYFN